MFPKIRRRLLLGIFLLAGFTWAAETDAEILRDLDFFMNWEVVREDAVFEEGANVGELEKVDLDSEATTRIQPSEGKENEKP